MIGKRTICLWYDGTAIEAARLTYAVRARPI
jgi:hypothetical protein